jgi:hypothetical protein
MRHFAGKLFILNYDAIAAAAAVIGICFTIFGVVFVNGKLAQKVSDHSLKLTDHEQRLDTHEIRITGHDVSLARLEGFREGQASMQRSDDSSKP